MRFANVTPFELVDVCVERRRAGLVVVVVLVVRKAREIKGAVEDEFAVVVDDHLEIAAPSLERIAFRRVEKILVHRHPSAS